MAMIALAGCTSRAEPWHLTNVAGHLPDLDFTLTGDDGRPVSGDSFKGRASLVYFGYTHCPDVCPETMGRLMQVLEKLGPTRRRCASCSSPSIRRATRRKLYTITSRRSIPSMPKD